MDLQIDHPRQTYFLQISGERPYSLRRLCTTYLTTRLYDPTPEPSGFTASPLTSTIYPHDYYAKVFDTPGDRPPSYTDPTFPTKPQTQINDVTHDHCMIT